MESSFVKLRKIKNGVHICPEIRLDAPFDAHNGIATYLATDEKVGNTLVSMYLAADGDAAGELEKTANFYRDILHLRNLNIPGIGLQRDPLSIEHCHQQGGPPRQLLSDILKGIVEGDQGLCRQLAPGEAHLRACPDSCAAKVSAGFLQREIQLVEVQ